MFRARKVGWGFVGRMHGCMAKAKWLTKPNAGAYVGRSAMMYCPPREASATLPAAPCFPRFLGKHARIGMSRAAPGYCRLLLASSAPELLAAPGDSQSRARGGSQFPALPDPWGKHQQRCRRLRLFPWLLPPTAAALAVAANCCRQLLPLLMRRNL